MALSLLGPAPFIRPQLLAGPCVWPPPLLSSRTYALLGLALRSAWSGRRPRCLCWAPGGPSFPLFQPYFAPVRLPPFFRSLRGGISRRSSFRLEFWFVCLPSLAMATPIAHSMWLRVALLDLQAWEDAGGPEHLAPAAFNRLVDTVDLACRRGAYAPPSRRSRRYLLRALNQVLWLLLRALGPSSEYGPVAAPDLGGDYRLPWSLVSEIDPSAAARAVRLSWIRRCLLTVRWIYSRISDVAEIPSISVDSIRPAVDHALRSLLRRASVLPRRPPAAVPPRAFRHVPDRLVREVVFVV